MVVTSVALSPEGHGDNLKRLCGVEFDLLIVGGGIVGAGAALDAASRGLHVAVIEAQDWAAGSSSRSSKLIHGGLRYLQTHDFKLVREALSERSVLSTTAPYLVRPIPFLFPLRHRMVERMYVGAGLLLYDLLARVGHQKNNLPFHRQLTKHQMLALAPALRGSSFIGAIEYWDTQVDDARHTLMVVRTAASYGAITVNRTHATQLLVNGARVCGARLINTETGEQFEVRAKAVISATGPWSNQLGSATQTGAGVHIVPSKGVHLVVPRSSIDASAALIFPTELSVLFVLPWGDHWLIGTTDTSWEYDLARPSATTTDIEYLLSTLNRFIDRPVARADIESVYVGLRPLVTTGESATTTLSHRHAIDQPAPGYVVISGGKYTTYRKMAKDVVDAAVAQADIDAPPSKTDEILLLGTEGLHNILSGRPAIAAEFNIDDHHLERLIHRYGGLIFELLDLAREDPALLRCLERACDYLGVEVAYAVIYEDARHLDDVLTRRTRIAMETRDRGAGAAHEVAHIMAPHLGWTDATIVAEVDAYRAQIATTQLAEQEPTDSQASATMQQLAPFLQLP